jgi:hypothetical protein
MSYYQKLSKFYKKNYIKTSLNKTDDIESQIIGACTQDEVAAR